MKRVAITGLGVVAPNAVGVPDFKQAIRSGRSGLRFDPELAEKGFNCQVSGRPQVALDVLQNRFDELTLRFMKSSGMLYGALSALEAWQDAGFQVDSRQDAAPLAHAGTVFGTGLAGVEPLRDAIYKLDQGEVRRLGSRVVEQTMASGISAWVAGLLGLGNHCYTNSSACATGTEALYLAAERIQYGKASIMIAGSCDAEGPYMWGGFDSMKVLNRSSNHEPHKASSPMSANAAGFIPGAGAAALVLEEYEHAKARGAHIYAEYLGGAVNAGGQRQGGSMTAPNPNAVVLCIQQALADAQVQANQVNLISGHLTATKGDVLEIQNWTRALNRSGSNFPTINSTKSMIGHCLGAAGSIELVALVLEIDGQFAHPSLNTESIHPSILNLIDQSCIPSKTIEFGGELRVAGKAGFGFGDVNAVVFLGKNRS
jgi:3-oxoacyl-(acyl-carrier-protein) synthase